MSNDGRKVTRKIGKLTVHDKGATRQKWESKKHIKKRKN